MTRGRAIALPAKGMISLGHGCNRLNTRLSGSLHRHCLSKSLLLPGGWGVRHPAAAAESSVEEILSAIGLNDEDAVTVLCAASAADTQDAVRNITGAQVDAVACALADTGVPARHLGKLLRQCPQFLTCSSDTIRRRVELLREKAGILPPGSARLAWDAPEVLCRQEAFDNALVIAERLRSCGVSEAALSRTAAKCPQLFTTQAQEFEESLAFMTEKLHLTSAQIKKALPALARGPRTFVRDLQGIFLDKSYAEVVQLLRRKPVVFEANLSRTRGIVELLAAAGLTSEETWEVVERHPAILKQRPAGVRMKLALVTKVLGHEVRSVLGSPFLIFAKSISGNSGPRFSFLRKHMPDKATNWSPSTLLRSTDKDFARIVGVPPEVYQAHKQDWQAEHRRKRARSS